VIGPVRIMNHAERIERERNRLGWSQRKLARLAGVNPTQLGRILKGTRGMTVATMDKIDNALKGATDDRK
jgi:transcriptional regulator with XRE-family HTH domain